MLLYLDSGSHGDPSTRTFGGHKGFYDGQLPAVILSGVHVKQSPINLPKKVCHPWKTFFSKKAPQYFRRGWEGAGS